MVVFVRCVKGEVILKLGYLYLKQDITILMILYIHFLQVFSKYCCT